MKVATVLALLFIPHFALAQTTKNLAPTSRAQDMLGDVGVMAKRGDDRCNVALFEDAVAHGYRIQVDAGCASAFAVMSKVAAWRVYKDGVISFADANGVDLVRFRGKGYKRYSVSKIDGIRMLHSAQESAE